jgi:quinohemoprotein ethanol dehydrogenase
MAYSPLTGLVYLAAKVDTMSLSAPDPEWKYDPDRDNVGADDAYDGPLLAKFGHPPPRGELLAWDPVRQKAAWRVSYPVVEGGGVLATAGNLVFQGRADGMFAAYRANNGKQLWTFDGGAGIMAPPMTYLVDGEQYVSVLAGWGGPSGLFNGPLAGKVKPGSGRMLTFKLGGSGVLNAPAFGHANLPAPMESHTSPQVVKEGQHLYGSWCARCHGWNAIAGPLPDLRYASKQTLDGIEAIVLGGTRAAAGMPSYAKLLNAEQVQAIRAFIVARARESAGEGPKR